MWFRRARETIVAFCSATLAVAVTTFAFQNATKFSLRLVLKFQSRRRIDRSPNLLSVQV